MCSKTFGMRSTFNSLVLYGEHIDTMRLRKNTPTTNLAGVSWKCRTVGRMCLNQSINVFV